MANVLTFATRAEFDVALASGGAIANLMDSVTSANPSIVIVAHITESGETITCGTNVMVDRKSAGVGDYVVWDSTNGRYQVVAQKWLDNNYPAQPTQKIMKVSMSVLPARFSAKGTIVKVFEGGKVRIAGNATDLPYTTTDTGDYAWDVPNNPHYTNVMKMGGGVNPTDPTTNAVVNIYDWCAFPSQRLQENYFSGGSNVYLPITRSAWDTAIAGLNTADPTATITIDVNGTNVNICPYNYDFDYDKFVAYYYKPIRFAIGGCYEDEDGAKNTLNTVNAYLGKTDKDGNTITKDSTSFACGYCYNYDANAPQLGKHQWFLGVMRNVGDFAELTHTFLTPRPWHSYYYWSSTQYSAYYEWFLHLNGDVNYDYKYYAFAVVPLADLILDA